MKPSPVLQVVSTGKSNYAIMSQYLDTGWKLRYLELSLFAAGHKEELQLIKSYIKVLFVNTFLVLI